MSKYKALVPIRYNGQFYYPADGAFSITQKDFNRYFDGRGLVEVFEQNDETIEIDDTTAPKKRGRKSKKSEINEETETIKTVETEIFGENNE